MFHLTAHRPLPAIDYKIKNVQPPSPLTSFLLETYGYYVYPQQLHPKL